MTDPLLELLRTQPRLAQLAAYPFEFDIDRVQHCEDVRLASGASLEPIAGDDSGGTYFVCDGGPVLYASSEGDAGLIGADVREALEVLIGLPECPGGVGPEDDEERILAAVAEAEEELREAYGPTLDADRAELLAGLGLPERSPVELLARLHAAGSRTEPDFVLLNAREGLAYRLMHDEPRPPVRDAVLAAGREDLARLRAAGSARGMDVAAALRAARYDSDERDPPWLREVVREETARGGTSDELRLAEELLHRHARAGVATEPVAPATPTGPDPDESELTWIRLAGRRGLTELARVRLIRMLDDTGPADVELIGALAEEFALLGDSWQAARARRLYASLQD
ncbi:hypothetical protein AB0J57_32685 [Streptomyces sp. NPDC049837]|uniref:hypothetical protein n=1 Tax=Streptomyces sp. NPDC049837 TaxID=3155277 RepID=UPI0034384474